MDSFLVFSQWVSEYLDGTGILVGLITAIPIFWTWYSLTWGQKRKEKRWTYNAIHNIHGKIHAVLIVDLLPNKDIKTPVLRYLKQHQTLNTIDEGWIFCINHQTTVTPDTLTSLAKELQEIHKSLQRLGADSLHLFFAGPAIAATLVGAEFGNSIPVYLYHHDQGYENFGLLNRRYI